MARQRKNESERIITRAASLTPRVDQMVIDLAAQRDWSQAKTLGYLAQQGLAALGQMITPEQQPDAKSDVRETAQAA